MPQAVVLAGGLGTRLRPVLDYLPKSMAPVDGRPFLEVLLAALARQGVTRFHLCVGYRREAITGHFGDGSRWGWEIRYSVEEAPLGTGGALWNASSHLAGKGPFLLLNGDTYLEIDLGRLIDFHSDAAAGANALGTIAVRESPDAAASGRVDMDPRGRILSFREKDMGGPGSGRINAGVSLFEEDFLRFLPADRPSSLEREVIPAALEMGAVLFGYPVTGTLIDIGTEEGYRRIRDYLGGPRGTR